MSTNRSNDFPKPIPITEGGTGAITAAGARSALGITIGAREIVGTADEILVVNGDGSTGNPTIFLQQDLIAPGTGSMTIPGGTTGERPVSPALGMIRKNTDTNKVEVYFDGAWTDVGAPAFAWNPVPGATQLAVVNNGYIIENSAQTTVTLPDTAPEGSVVSIQGKGAGGWILQAGASQTIQLGSAATTSGGGLTSANQWDNIQVVCVTADTTWSVSYVYSTGLSIS